MDHVLVAPGASTAETAHESVGEVYYVLAGSGTVKVAALTRLSLLEDWLR